MNAPHLAYGLGLYYPYIAVAGEVPLHGEIFFRDIYVGFGGVPFAGPVPAIAGHKAGFVAGAVALEDQVLIRSGSRALLYAALAVVTHKPHSGFARPRLGDFR